MKYSFWILFTIFSFIFSLNPLIASGDLQVFCETGVEIFIDDIPKGITTVEDHGLFIENLQPGQHNLKGKKPNFATFETTISIQQNETSKQRIEFSQKSYKVEDYTENSGSTSNKTGNLVLKSIPLGAKVTIDSTAFEKETDFKVIDFKIGKHTIQFERDGKFLRSEFDLDEGVTVELKANFKKGIVFVTVTGNEKESAGNEINPDNSNENNLPSATPQVEPVQVKDLSTTATIVAQPSAKIRMSPSARSEMIGKISFGTNVYVSGSTQTGKFKWYRIQVQAGKQGWVREDLLDFSSTKASEQPKTNKTTSDLVQKTSEIKRNSALPGQSEPFQEITESSDVLLSRYREAYDIYIKALRQGGDREDIKRLHKKYMDAYNKYIYTATMKK